MKYSNEIVIDLPREKVIELFDNVENLEKWQPGFLGFEHISGEPGKEGSKSKMMYQMGKRKVEMIETITKANFPTEFNGTYEAKNVFNIINNRFEQLSSSQTKWISHNEFKFSGFMRIMGFLMPGAFSKQSYKYMEYFKDFAEKEAKN